LAGLAALSAGLAGCAGALHREPRHDVRAAGASAEVRLEIVVDEIDLTDRCLSYTVVNRGGRLELWDNAFGHAMKSIRLVDSEGRMVRLAPDRRVIVDPGPGYRSVVIDAGGRLCERACFGECFWERYDESPAAAKPLVPPLTWVVDANVLGPSESEFGPNPVLGKVVAGGIVPVVKRAGRVVP
jgi:hypothetical protein